MTSPIRLGGLASGIDTDSIIKQLMTVERFPLDKLEQKKQLTTWKVDAYREVNRSLMTLRNSAVDLTLSKNFYARTASSSDSSLVAVNATPANGSTSLQITSVDSLAKAASTFSQLPSGETEVQDKNNLMVTRDTLLTDLNMLDPTTLSFRSSETSVFTSLELTATSTVGDLLTKLNAKGSGLSAFFDDATGKLSITSRQTGSDATVEFNDNSLTDAFKMANGSKGEDALLTVNGLTITRATNTITIDDVTFTLNKVFGDGDSVSLTTKPDTQAVFDNIKSFVKQYNETIALIDSKYSEQKNRDFPPLTKDQKENLSEDEIKKWEEKAQSGLLRSDSKLRNGLDRLRSAWSSTDVTTSGPNQLYQIGLSTSKDFRAGGKIEIDEVKLKEAIESNPEDVYKLFTDQTNGLLSKVRDVAGDIRIDISRVAGYEGGLSNSFSLGIELGTIDRKIDFLNRQLIDKENTYYRRFAAMEKAMNQANSQAGYLQQFMAGGM